MTDVVIPGSLVAALVAVWGVISTIVVTLHWQVIEGWKARLADAQREMAAKEVEREYLLGLAIRGVDMTDRALSVASTRARATPP